jgi:hypothetical protein
MPLLRTRRLPKLRIGGLHEDLCFLLKGYAIQCVAQ